MRKVFFTETAASPRGHYSQAIITEGRLLFTAAHGPFEPGTGNLVGKTFREQAIRSFENTKAIAEASGASLKDVVKVNIFLQDWKYIPELDEIFQEYFPEDPPARRPLKADLPWYIMVEAVIALPEG